VVENEFGLPLLHPLLASRWSPTLFDAQHELSPAEVEALLEAARWAPSAGNSQPWAFIVAVRGDARHERLIRHLYGSTSTWAPTASLLVANLAHRYVEGTEWAYSDFSLYDLGQAVAHMTLQAQALGLSARQFRAFDQDSLTAEFDVPPHWEITTMAAYGRAASTPLSSAGGGAAKHPPHRERRPVTELLWPQA
jgi:nitroreductase